MRALRDSMRFFRRERPGASGDDLMRAAAIIAAADDSRPDDWLAMTGDKQFMFSPQADCFLAYSAQGRAVAAAGAPVGSNAVKALLVKNFVSNACSRRRRVFFYGVCAEDESLLAAAGLKLFKIGETAVLDLPQYSLTGKRGDNLRSTRNRLAREGAVLEIMRPDEISVHLEVLRKISDEWLDIQKGREKAFSLGFFSDRYLMRTPMAVIRHHGELVAFANLWPTRDRSVLSYDLMRYGRDAPKAVIDFMVMELAFYGQRENYQMLDIGMAPLSGLDNQPHAQMLARMGDFVFSTAERFYGFRGLRKFKEKFHPRWAPRYIAAANQFSAARGLIDCALLTSKGWRPADKSGTADQK